MFIYIQCNNLKFLVNNSQKNNLYHKYIDWFLLKDRLHCIN